MSNLATITNNILADSGIDDINVIVSTGSYANPAWITSLAWTKITGAPSNIVTGTGTTNTIPRFTGTSTIGDSSIQDNTGEVSISKRLFLSTGGQSILLTPNLTGTVNRIETSALPLEITTTGSAIRLAAGGVTAQLTLASSGVVTLTNLAGTGSRIVVADAGGNLSASSALSGYIQGSGTTNYLPRFTGASTIGISGVTDDGATVTLLSRALSGSSANFSTTVVADRYSSGSTNAFPNVAYAVRGTINGNNDTWGVYAVSVTHAPSANNALAVGFATGGTINRGTFTGLSYRGFLQESSMAVSGTGTLATAYGIFINPLNIATSNYSAYFAQNVGIGNPTPSYLLDVSGFGRFRSSRADLILEGTSATEYSRVIFVDSNVNERAGVQYINPSFSESGRRQKFELFGNNGIDLIPDGVFSAPVLALTATGSRFRNNLGVGGAAATYPLTVYNGGDATTAAFGGTARGLRVDNDGVNSVGMTSLFGVDNTFYGSYQPIRLAGSVVYLGIGHTNNVLTVTNAGNVLIGPASDNGARLQVSGTSTFSDTLLISIANASNKFQITSTTGTNAAYQRFTNSGGNYYIGPDNSAGTALFVTGGVAYGFGIVTESAQSIVLGTNNIARLTIAHTTGAATFSSAYVSFGNNGYIRNDSAGWLQLQGGSNGTRIMASGNGTPYLTITDSTGAATFSSSVTAGGGLFSSNISSFTYEPSSAGAIQPGVSEFISTGFNVAGASSVDISTISLPSNTQWKAIITGGFANNFEGGGLPSPTFSRDIDGTNNTISVGSVTLTFSRNASTGKLQVSNGNAIYRATFTGTIHLVTFPQSSIPPNSRAFFGNVGIGIAAPLSPLHIQTAEPTLRIVDSNDSGVMFIGNTGGFSYIRAFSRDFRFLNAAGTSLLGVNANGNLLVGTTSDNGAKLQVNGSMTVGSITGDRCFIGQVPSYGPDFTQFSHISRAGANQYSFLSGNAGDTYVNSVNAQPIYFRHNNVNLVTISSSGLATFISGIAGYGITLNHTSENLRLKMGAVAGGIINIQGEIISSSGAYPIVLNRDGGNVGVGLNPQAALDIRGVADQAGFNNLVLRSGNSDDATPESNQILFGYAGTMDYAHAIKTRHQSGSQAGNSIEFWVWRHGDSLSTQAGQRVMVAEGNGVRVANSAGTLISPVDGSVLTVNGLGYFDSGLRTSAPAGGVSAGNWRLGDAISTSIPTPNRLVRVTINGTLYSLLAFSS